MSAEALPEYKIFVQPDGPFGEYIEATTDALGHALRMLDELGKAPGIPSQGQEFCYADGDELRIEDDDDRVLKIWSREKGVIFEDLSDCPDVEVVGWQVLDADGHNVHGDDEFPFDITSFSILIGEAAKAARRWVSENPGYSVGPVRDGDIEEPEYVNSISPRAPRLG